MKKTIEGATKKQRMKKIPAWARFVIGVALILGLGYAVLNYVPFIAKFDHYVIGSDSMEPVIMVGDVVIIDTAYPLDDLQVGDIIAFRADIHQDGNIVVVVHYVYAITIVDGARIFNTRPEVSASPDGWDLTDADIVGLHVATIPKIGPLLLFAQSTIGRIAIVADIVLVYVVLELFSKPKKPKIVAPVSGDSPAGTAE